MGEPYTKESTDSVKGESVTKEYNVDGSLRSEHTDTAVRDSTTNYLNGTTNPYWKIQVKNNLNATTVLDAVRERIDLSPFFLEEVISWGNPNPGPGALGHRNKSGTCAQLPNAQTTPLSGLQEQANNMALKQYVQQCRSAQTAVEGGLILGELAETLRMLRGRGIRLFDGFRGLKDTLTKRGHNHKVRRLPPRQRRVERQKIVSDTWLEYQFGWRPLLNDISDLIDAIKEQDMFNERIVTNVSGYGVAKDRRHYNPPTQVGGTGLPTITAREKEMSQVIVKYKGQVGAKPTAAGYAIKKVGLGLDDFVPTLWELVPYSFLADYFSNMGEMISAGSMGTDELLWTNKTVIVLNTAEFLDFQPQWYEPQSGKIGQYPYSISRIYTAMPAAKHAYKNVTREPYTGSLVPSFEFSIPKMGTRWLNMLALVNGFRSLERSFR